MNNRDVLNKLHEDMGKALEAKINEIDEYMKPYTTVSVDGCELIDIPNKEVALEYERLNNEFKKVVGEIRLMHQN